MNTKVFDNNYVGIKLSSVSEIMKYNALKDSFSICDESEYYFDEYVEVTHDNGEVTEREPTENEKLERILQAFKDKKALYATFWLDCGEVWPTNATTLQSKFYVGQKVFAMRNNKIVEGEIVHLSLTRSKNNDKLIADYKSNSLGENVFHIVASEISPNFTNYYCFDNRHILEDKLKRALNDDQVLLNVGNQYFAYGFDEIFATKEELVKHLMEEQS